MKYPSFYQEIEKIILKDDLSQFLGTFEDGIIEFNYLDVVKSAGHSCPTVAGAYLVCLKALQYLYPNEIPQRGQVSISFNASFAEGVNGVIAQVFSHITGATQISGFKGIGGKFVRHSLMDFDADINGQYKFTRKDTGAYVELSYQPNVAVDPRQQGLMQKIMMNQANEQEKTLFGELWQKRVEAILTLGKDDQNILQINN